MNRVQDLIIQALNTADNNQLRQQAENTIFGLLKQNPAEFFLTCAHIVADTGKVEKIRQSAASVMKAILSKRADNNGYFWDLVPPGVRPQIKDVLLNNLISPYLTVMRSSANVIAQIAAIEISRGQWLEIVGTLAQNSLHQELNIRRASITTLGFICEELKGQKTNLTKDTSEQILGSIIVCLREQGEQIVEISLGALRDSISFLRTLLENESVCTPVMEQIFPFLATDYRVKVYEVLFQFGRDCYHLLGNYINPIAQATVQHIGERNQNAILALQFWDTVGSEYLKRREDASERVAERGNLRNLIEEMHDIILSHIMASILILTKDDVDFPELRESSVKTLTTVVACCGRQVVDKVTEGVSRVLQSHNAGERQASALLFSCLVDFQDRGYIEHCFSNGFVHLYQLIDDKEPIVRRNTLNGFVTLSECFPSVFLKNPSILNIFDHLLKLSINSDETIQVLALTILLNITDFFKENNECQIVRQPDKILQGLVDQFTKNLQHNSNKEATEKIIGIIMNIVMSTNKRKVIEMLLDHLISLYMQLSKIKIQDQEIVMGQVLAIVHTSVLAMVKFPVDANLKRKAYELLDMHINYYGVETEGIHLISALALCMKRDFLNEHFDHYWEQVMKGLDMIQQKPIFRGALTCVQDIARSNELRISGKLTNVFQKLVKYMHNPIERQLKTEILRCFGDLCLGLKSYAEVYVEGLLQICDDCCVAVINLLQIEQEREYAEELKDTLIEMYHCLVFALNQQNGNINKKLACHFARICEFIVNTCDTKFNPTVDYVKNCLSLVFDSALFYSKSKDFKENVFQIVNSPQIGGLVEILRNHRDREGVAEVLAFIEDKLRNQRR